MKIVKYVIPTLVLLAVSTVGAVQQTLAERVRGRQGAIEVLILREFSPVDLSELV